MKIPAKKWHDALKIRHSRRKFLNQQISDDILQCLQKICHDFRPFGETAYGVLIDSASDQVFKGIIGSYGKIKNAQAYIAFIGNTSDPHVDEKVGYVGEGIILEATALGLNTCWIAGFFKPEIVRQQITIKSQEKVYAITPLGYSNKQYSWNEKMMSSVVKSRTRKEITDLCSGLDYSDWDDWQNLAIKAARIAPSAINRQPWRFHLKPDNILVSTDGKKEKINTGKRLDCGIAMLHLEVATLDSEKKGKWTFLQHPQVAKFELE